MKVFVNVSVGLQTICLVSLEVMEDVGGTVNCLSLSKTTALWSKLTK